jgi:DNA-binding IclR family transcriptional regulator
MPAVSGHEGQGLLEATRTLGGAIARPALAAERALQVIDLLILHPTERFSLTEIARRTSTNPASTHALLQALLRSGYVQREPTRKTYALGPALVAAGEAALQQLPSIQVAKREIDALGHELGLESVVTTVVHDEILVVANGPHVSPYGPPLVLGQRVPLLPPMGLIFLAFSSPKAMNLWLQRAKPPLSRDETDQLREVLAVVRKAGYFIAFESETRRGIAEVLARSVSETTSTTDLGLQSLLAELGPAFYAVELDESETYDVSMITAPVFDANGSVSVAITLKGFAPARSAVDLLVIAQRLRGTARVITKRTYGREPPDLD